MDPDVRSKTPGLCPRCKMRLVANLPEPRQWPVALTTLPRVPQAGQIFTLRFDVKHPDSGLPVRQFETVHEKLFHLFVVHEDLHFFAHEHPQLQRGAFTIQTRLPRPGLYRLLCDFYPQGGTPQLVAKTVLVPGPVAAPQPLQPDTSPKQGSNLQVSLRTEPAVPLAGQKTRLFFTLTPSEGLEPYLGAWAHMLCASADLVDLIHAHPTFGEPGATIQFNLIFPREGLHRLWVQLQRQGQVNTVAFTLPVQALR